MSKPRIDDPGKKIAASADKVFLKYVMASSYSTYLGSNLQIASAANIQAADGSAGLKYQTADMSGIW